MIRTTRVGAAAAKRRRAGGRLAVGRPSETRAGLHREREYVRRRAGEICEICWERRVGRPGTGRTPGTDFAHVVARSQSGPDDHTNALWLCRTCHSAMTAPYSRGRLLVTCVVVKGPHPAPPERGFAWELVRAANKWAYQRGEYETLGSGFIRAEMVDG